MFNNREVAGCLCVRYKREKEMKKTKIKIRILIERVADLWLLFKLWTFF